MYYYCSQSAALELFEGEEGDRLCQSLLEFGAIYLSGITLAILQPTGRDKFLDCLKEAHKRNIKICFDTNFRSRFWSDLQVVRD